MEMIQNKLQQFVIIYFTRPERGWFLFSIWDIMGTKKQSGEGCFTELIPNDGNVKKTRGLLGSKALIGFRNSRSQSDDGWTMGLS
jgi:hypothetical protein